MTGVPHHILFTCALMGLLFLFYWGYRVRTAHSGILTLDVYLLAGIMLPVMAFSPFAFSPENMRSTGQHSFGVYVPYISAAFYMTVIGLAAFALSAILFSHLRVRPPGIVQVEKALLGYWMSGEGCILMAGTVCFCLLALIALGGNPTRMRETVQEDTALRPLLNLMNGTSSFATMMILLYAYRQRDWRFTALGLISAGATGACGTRAPVVIGLINYVVLRVIAAADARILRSAGILLIAVTLAIVVSLSLESVRRGEEMEAATKTSWARFAYGNNLSDVRDFAWIMSGWDGKYLVGRTYVSGALAIVPSNLMPWRREWAWAPFSTEGAGMGRDVAHFGLRPGMFGEAYFNFGLPGVIGLGMLLGGLLGSVMNHVGHRVEGRDTRTRAGFLLCGLFYLQQFVLPLSMSSGWFSYYIAFGVVGFGTVMRLSGLRILPPLSRTQRRLDGRKEVASAPYGVGGLRNDGQPIRRRSAGSRPPGSRPSQALRP